MASGISILYNNEKVDLEEICEISRGSDDYNLNDRFPPIPSGLIKSGEDLTSTDNFLMPLNLELNEGIDLSSFITLPNHVLNLATKKGYRPRIIKNFLFDSFVGSTTRRYYVIKRRETSIDVYWSTNKFLDYTLNTSFPASIFPNSYIPHILTFRITGGGGGGQGGGYGIGGQGGGGGAIVYFYGRIRNTISGNPTVDDLIFTLFKGGAGGPDETGTGIDGSDTIVEIGGNSLFTAGGGTGGYRNTFTAEYSYEGGEFEGESVNTFLFGVNGGGGGFDGLYAEYPEIEAEDAEDINFGQQILFEQVNFFSPRGYDNESDQQNGRGGGASLGPGGDGAFHGLVGKAGVEGSGGGGGSGWVWWGASSEDGGPGGPGVLSLYY